MYVKASAVQKNEECSGRDINQHAYQALCQPKKSLKPQADVNISIAPDFCTALDSVTEKGIAQRTDHSAGCFCAWRMLPLQALRWWALTALPSIQPGHLGATQCTIEHAANL